MADYDAIIVGSGCAGAIAAYELAKADKTVLVVERGNFAGSKNMTGGRLYLHSLKEVFPNCAEEAPLERRIAHERISLMTSDASFTVDFSSNEMLKDGQDSYSVLRASLDQWLAEQAEEAGADYIYGITVEELVKDGSKVIGIRAGDDEITGEVVLLCDGANSLLAESAVGFQRPKASTLAVGIKQVIEIPASVIEDRVLAGEGEGAAWLFVGDVTKGHVGGGFMYTNKDSVSLGIVATISDLATSSTPIYQMLEDFKAHPAIKPLIKGGKVLEHSGHMVPEGGRNTMPKLVGDGVMIVGDSAMMCMNLGYMIRGMDFAIAAGMHAGRSAVEALDAGDTSAQGLAGYISALENSFVLKDLEQFKRFPHFMESTTRIFNEYPVLVRDVFNKLFVVDGSPVAPIKRSMMPLVKKIGFGKLFKDARGGMKAL
ncbi:MAG: FAD-dependent oxidoreductase [Coriobacteriia bacterium]|nr:FAD-dependent oxidoreductase [Coriobacteriia bacterium]MCL2750042.1 FAD-dependent oxidoreductase [Coriobacteriia bacterium]